MIFGKLTWTSLKFNCLLKFFKWRFVPFILAIVFGITALVFIFYGFCSERDLFTAGAAMFTAAALFYTAHCYQSDGNNKKSEFYLIQIQEYFKNAIECISQENNNIKWHQGIDCLITAERLSNKLTQIEHQVIYMTDYINLGYELLSILDSIDSYKFFYGLKNYKEREDKELYDEASGQFLKKKTYLIAVKSLLQLNAFTDKAGKARFDLYDMCAVDKNVFYREYFRKNIVNISSINDIPIISRQKIIIDFIESIKNQSKG